MTPDDDPVLLAYMRTDEFKRRCAALRERALADVKAGQKPPPPEEIARELHLPLDVVEGGLRHSLEKYLLRNAPIGEPN